MIVVAMPEEITLIDKINEPIIVTGVGAINVIKSLINIDRSTPILNIGYAGSNTISIGKRVLIGKVDLYHPNVQYAEHGFHLSGNIHCYTSSDFVTETKIEEPCVFDMELAYILAMGFTNVSSIKVVSDNLSKDEFDGCLEKNGGK